MNALDEKHGGVSPELAHDHPIPEHDCPVPEHGGLCPAFGVFCPNWLADEWPFPDDPPDPL